MFDNMFESIIFEAFFCSTPPSQATDTTIPWDACDFIAVDTAIPPYPQAPRRQITHLSICPEGHKIRQPLDDLLRSRYMVFQGLDNGNKPIISNYIDCFLKGFQRANIQAQEDRPGRVVIFCQPLHLPLLVYALMKRFGCIDRANSKLADILNDKTGNPKSVHFELQPKFIPTIRD